MIAKTTSTYGPRLSRLVPMATKMPLKTMAPMIPSREHGGGNDQERRTGEDGHHDKQVVDRQHFLQRITRYKQAGNLSTVVDVEETGKCHRNHNPEYGPERRTLQGNGLVITVHKQVNKDGTD